MKEIDEFCRTFSEMKAIANIEKYNQRKEDVKIIHEKLPGNLKPLVEQEPLANLPSYCACGEKFDELHAMFCKKGGFVFKRHDNIRDLLTCLFE